MQKNEKYYIYQPINIRVTRAYVEKQIHAIDTHMARRNPDVSKTSIQRVFQISNTAQRFEDTSVYLWQTYVQKLFYI